MFSAAERTFDSSAAARNAAFVLLRAREIELKFPAPAVLMAIINVTPDSFSDGGTLCSIDSASRALQQAVAEGATILDIGGESTRPDASEVPEEEEMRRVVPLLRSISPQDLKGAIVSIDTMKPAVARAAIDAGARIVNNVAANREDLEMWKVVRDTGAAYVVMHMQGTPRTMQINPNYRDVVREVSQFFADQMEKLTRFGVALEQIVLDPGIGFGKTCEHNLELLAGLHHFTKYGRPLLVGASRKGFIGQITGTPAPRDRLPGSLACAVAAVLGGAQIVRAHDVAATRQALQMTDAIRSRQK